MNYIELLGYLASILVAISLMMSNIVKLRIINMIGALAFAMYGLVINAYPVAFVNGWIFFVNIFYLVRMYKSRSYFDFIHIADRENHYLRKFLAYHKEDVDDIYPLFDLDKVANPTVLFITRNMLPVGLFIYRKNSEDELEIVFDYVIPEYRDLENAHFLYSHGMKNLNLSECKRYVTRTLHQGHRSYFKKLGFVPDENDRELLIKNL